MSDSDYMKVMINTKKENPVADHFNDENHLNNKSDYKINSGTRSQQEQKTKTRESMDAIIEHTIQMA